MKRCVAAVACEPLRMELREFPLPPVGEEDGLLRVEATGICGTDWLFYRGGWPSLSFPLILGHETVGRIERIGREAARRWGVKEGDRVVIEEPFPCGRCWICRSVNYHLCPRGGRYGAIPISVPPALWGGFSEYLYLHPNSIVYKVSERISPELAPLFIPLSNGIRWVQHVGGMKIGDTVVIEGPGQHGLGCVIAAREGGAGCIIVTGLSRDHARLALARELGADHVIDVEREDARQRVAEITGGRMADLVIDVTAGAPEALQLAVDIVRVGGTVVLAGAKHTPVAQFDSDQIFLKEITIKGVYGRDFRAVEPALSLLESGRYPFSKLSSHTFSLAEADRALRVFAREEGGDRDPIHVSVIP